MVVAWGKKIGIYPEEKRKTKVYNVMEFLSRW
jgi:hypothetical protein